MKPLLKCIIFHLTIVAGASTSGCGDTNTHDGSDEPLNWEHNLSTCRPIILSGALESAEDCWAKLKIYGQRPENIEQWLAFQVELIKTVPTDPTRSMLRLVAIQELSFSPEHSVKYLPWLIDGVNSGFFVDDRVRDMAIKTIETIQKTQSSGQP